SAAPNLRLPAQGAIRGFAAAAAGSSRERSSPGGWVQGVTFQAGCADGVVAGDNWWRNDGVVTPVSPRAPGNRTEGAVGSLPPLVDPAESLTIDEVRRYSRHLIIPDVAMDGQKRLKNAKVLCIGAGGLGSPALMYLAAAEIGRAHV